MRVALILHDRVHEILEDVPAVPDWPPYANGEKPLLVEIGPEVKAGYIWENGAAIPPEVVEEDG